MTIEMYDLTNVRSTDAKLRYPVSAQRLFEIMSAEGAFGDYHPWVVKNPIIKWCGNGSEDMIEMKDGKVNYRTFFNWNPGVGYDIMLGPEKGPRRLIRWRIKGAGDQCVMTVQTFDMPWPKTPGKKRPRRFEDVMKIGLTKWYVGQVLRSLRKYVEAAERNRAIASTAV